MVAILADPRNKDAWRELFARQGSLQAMVAATPSGPAPEPRRRLGGLSETYETSGRGPGTVSSGYRDAGGVSYGSYQLATNRNRPQEFLATNGKAWAAEFQGAQPGTPAFSKTWAAIAAREPERFHNAQYDYIAATHYRPQAAQVKRQSGVDIEERSEALRDVVWSTAVQFGPGTPAVTTAIRNAGGARASDEAVIREIYAERTRRWPSDADRYRRELSDALEILRAERARRRAK